MSDHNNASSQGAGASPTIVHFARQPIYDRDLNVYGYELLFRESEHNAAILEGDREAGKVASARVLLNAIMDLDLEQIAESRPAFLNLSREFLLDDSGLLLAGDKTGIEVPCATCNDDEVTRTLKILSLQGFTIVLDDFSWQPGIERLLEQARLVKIDIHKTGEDELPGLLEQLRDWPVQRVALKVETREEFDRCQQLGFDYFQGFFLCKPRVVRAHRLPDSKINTLRLIGALQNPDVTPEELEAIIRNDLALHYRLLRTVNSTYYGLSVEVKSIAHAIVYLGIATIKRWAHLQLVAGTDDKPSEVLRLALVRARMCEQLMPNLTRETRDTAFTTGLFSLLDGALDTSMELILAHLPLDQDIVRALVDYEGPYGRLLRTVVCYENGEWEQLAQEEFFSLDSITACYLEALQWARAQFAALGA
ncbi:EAL and HDOD domain-containing protein [Haliea sp.]